MDIPQKLIDRAKSLGFTDEELKSYTAEQLDDILWKLAAGRSSGSRVPSVAPSPAPAPSKSDDDDVTFDKEVEDVLDPEVAKALKKALKDNLTRWVKKIESTVEDRIKNVQSSQSQVAVIDRVFNSLGPEWSKVVGVGSLHEIGDAERKRRQMIVAEAVEMSRQKGGDPLDYIPVAAQVLFGVASGWDRGSLHRPSGRNDATMPNGRQKALSALREQLRESGLSYNGQPEEDTLPE